MTAAPRNALAVLAAAIEDSGLVPDRGSGVVMVSGGADSTALLAGLAAHCSTERLHALHVDHGLRPGSARDAEVCRATCESLGVPLTVRHPDIAGGNVQQAARRARYDAAEAIAEELGATFIAVGHTATDLAETVIYRLAVSPGARALLGMPARRGRIIRPLLALERERVRELAGEAGLSWIDDPSNAGDGPARNRIRHRVLPVLRELNPKLTDALARTREEIASDDSALALLADALLGA
ncbi:MAG: tRNA lysidine(34) synthetase TilS, partial [Solirubrobacterales bacterium]